MGFVCGLLLADSPSDFRKHCLILVKFFLFSESKRGCAAEHMRMISMKKVIAIIEDDDTLRRGLKTVFLRQGYSVTTFEDGEGVVESFGNGVPDVVLCDYRLPSMNGIEILKEFRKTYVTNPFFLMTGYYKVKLASLAKSEGANDVFEKPLNMKMLIELITLEK